MLRFSLTGLVVLTAAAAARADTFPYKATVTDPEVKVRCGPSDKFEETGTLPRGTPLVVEREESNGWLAVTAPSGSVSWVQAQFINTDHLDGRFPRNVFVESDVDVSVAAGRPGLDQPLDVRRMKVPSGTVFVVVGQPAKHDGKTWYPITPPAGDVRYLPKSAVQFDKPVTSNFTVRVSESTSPLPPAAVPTGPATPAGGAVASVPGPAVTPAAGSAPAAKPQVNHPLWAQAEAAERENRLADAEKLYFQLAEEMNRPNGDHDVANLCYTRIHAIRDRQRGTRAAAVPAGTPTAFKPQPKEDRGAKIGAPEALPPAADAKDDRGEKAEWHTGKLVFATTTIDGPNRQVYLLEAPGGVVKMYVAPGPGVDLARYLGKQVRVYGAPSIRPQLAKPYMVATEAETPR